MILKIAIGIFFIFGICGGDPEFEMLSANRCSWDQGRKEMGKAYRFEISIVSHKKVKDVSFEYIYLEGEFIPVSKSSAFTKIKSNDTITLYAIQFINRPYKPESIYLEKLEDISQAILYRHKNEPCYIEIDTMQHVDCGEKIRRM